MRSYVASNYWIVNLKTGSILNEGNGMPKGIHKRKGAKRGRKSGLTIVDVKADGGPTLHEVRFKQTLTHRVFVKGISVREAQRTAEIYAGRKMTKTPTKNGHVIYADYPIVEAVMAVNEKNLAWAFSEGSREQKAAMHPISVKTKGSKNRPFGVTSAVQNNDSM